MFVNKEMFSIQSSSNFAHADQVAPLEMAVRHVKMDPTACKRRVVLVAFFFHVLG